MTNLRFLRTAFFFSILLISLQGYSQVGFTISRYNQDVPDWETAVFQNTANQDLLKNGYSIGVDYWLKPLKEYRVELFPELLVSYSKDDLVRNNRNEQFQLASAGFNLNMNFYLLNFHSDCDCPTFSKQESFFEKGFFLQISPGYHYFRGVYEVTDGSELSKNIMNEFVPKLGVGIGVDIGVSDLVTVTPIVKYNRHFNAEWEQLSLTVSDDPLLDTPPDISSINQFTYGLHIGIRWRQ